MQRNTGEVAKRRLDVAIRRARASVDASVRGPYERLLEAVWSGSDLLSRRSRAGPEVNVALVAFALRAADFRRDPGDFVARGRSAHEVLASLAEHLFADYAMPPFMTSAWLEGDVGERRPSHEWYVRLGRGESLRRLGIPMKITRAMAHVFPTAPRHLTVNEALRWAEARSLGGEDALVTAIVASRLGRVLDHEDFHRTLVEFFVRTATAPEHVGPIVDYVRGAKLDWREGFLEDGTLGLVPPPEPGLDLRGRTTASLLRAVERWHLEIGRCPLRDTTWPSTGYEELRITETVPRTSDDHETSSQTELRIYTITEVLSSYELSREGREMRHCVASYFGECLAGRASIWSLRVQSKEGTRRLLTIEVDPRSRTIRQMRRKCNALAGEKERAFVAAWATKARLALPERRAL